MDAGVQAIMMDEYYGRAIENLIMEWARREGTSTRKNDRCRKQST